MIGEIPYSKAVLPNGTASAVFHRKMEKTPKGLRLHIGIFGRRNVGKSSVLNALTGQDVTIVSDIPGTTTDPVEKPMEFLPLGPVLFVDTAGLDDVGTLGELRKRKSIRVFDRTELALLVTEAYSCWGEYEEMLLEETRHRRIPTLVVLNKIDLNGSGTARTLLDKRNISYICMSATKGIGVPEAKQAIIQTVPDDWYKQSGILDGIVSAGHTVILVIPIDKEAPKGRIILPQVQVLRDILDKQANALVINERGIEQAIKDLKFRPRIVITDSQVFHQVSEATPDYIPMTSFSVVFARYKGDLFTLTAGAKRIATLNETDRVLICEACTHHPVGDDIGRNKIPRWLRAKVGDRLKFDVVAGRDFPDDLGPYSLVIHCGACVFNRREMLSRICHCTGQNVPITNYGLVIAYIHGILDRVLAPFQNNASLQATIHRLP